MMSGRELLFELLGSLPRSQRQYTPMGVVTVLPHSDKPCRSSVLHLSGHVSYVGTLSLLFFSLPSFPFFLRPLVIFVSIFISKYICYIGTSNPISPLQDSKSNLAPPGFRNSIWPLQDFESQSGPSKIPKCNLAPPGFRNPIHCHLEAHVDFMRLLLDQ